MLSPQDKQHLRFIYNRMVELHGENPNVDYMLKFDKIIEDKPIIIPKSDSVPIHWSLLVGEKYHLVDKLIQNLNPTQSRSDMETHEEIFITHWNGNTYRKRLNRKSGIVLLEVLTIGSEDLGICVEVGCCKGATKDYNGHNHFVCDSCYDHLNNEFDEEYK